jgi:hypothetical protein
MIRPPIAYKSTTDDNKIPNADEGKLIDDPMGPVSITIYAPAHLWIEYRAHLYFVDEGNCKDPNVSGYMLLNVDGADYPESKYVWRNRSPQVHEGVISTLLVPVSCASYPCTKTIKARFYFRDEWCPCQGLAGNWYCDMRHHIVERNLFVVGFRQ